MNPAYNSRHNDRFTRSERELFGPRRTGSQGMPDAAPLIRSLALSAIEVIDGARPVDQLAPRITESVAARLAMRQTLNTQRRAVACDNRRIPHAIGNMHLTKPADGVIEATVTVHSRVKTKAVALRLESIDNRWRATALDVL